MKKCPNCGELIGDNVGKCFNCFFDMTNPEANKIAEENKKKENVKPKKKLLNKDVLLKKIESKQLKNKTKKSFL